MLKKIKIAILSILVLTAMLQVSVLANSVEYRGEAEGLIATPNDFFLNLGELLPGDSKEDFAYIKNTTDDDIEVFFKTEPLGESEYYDEIDYSLLEKISLKISLKETSNSEEKLLYEGNLGAELMNEYVSLGEYKKGEDGEFIFRIEVPTELRNDYTLATTKVKWVFAVEKKEAILDNDNVTDDENNDDENNDDVTDDKNNGNIKDDEDIKDDENLVDDSSREENDSIIDSIIEDVKTGDGIYYIIGLLVLIILVNILITLRRRRK